MQRHQYPALAAALLMFTVAIVISSYKIVVEYEVLTDKFVPNLWVAAQANIEYLRFVNQLERHTFDAGGDEAQELATRLYIFGSRLPLLLEGSEFHPRPGGPGRDRAGPEPDRDARPARARHPGPAPR